MTILEALTDTHLFAGAFPAATWRSWFAFLAALYGLPLEREALPLFQQATGRSGAPTTPTREGWMVVGRRGGKSRVAALLAVWTAISRDWRPHLGPGEKATIAVIAADRQQARVVFRYVMGLIDRVPMIAARVTRRTVTSVELGPVVVEVHTCSYRSTRGYSFAAVIADEIAFWMDGEVSANPAEEVLAAIRPGLATLPGSLLVALSSPHARRGPLWQAYRTHFGNDDSATLVWVADTATMNPSVDPAVIAAAYEADPVAAASEYGAQFRSDLEQFVSQEALEACVVPGRHELPPAMGVAYFAFTDPSGGSQDSFTLGIAHGEGERVVLDLVRERRPPFSPDAVVAEYAATLKQYGVTTVVADRYAGAWVTEAFAKVGIHCEQSAASKSELYGNLLPRLNAHTVDLLDHPRITAQLLGLERRTARGGRDSIDHGPSGHDDVANSVAGAVVAVAQALVNVGEVHAVNLADRPHERIAWEPTRWRDLDW